MIEKVHFTTLEEAINYAKDNGGWIFSNDKKIPVFSITQQRMEYRKY